MKKARKDAHTDQMFGLLAEMNPAPERPLTQAEDIRSRALLVRIQADEQAGAGAAVGSARRGQARRGRAVRWVAIPAAVAVAVVAALVVVNTPESDDVILAAPLDGWTAAPAPMSVPATNAADAACNRAIADLGSADPSAPDFEVISEPVAADLRGEWGLLILEGVNRTTGGVVDASCLVRFEAPDLPVVQRVTLDERTLLEQQRPLSIEGSPQGNVATAQRMTYRFEDGGLIWSMATESLFVAYDGAASFSTMHGRVADDVVSVTLHSVLGGDVEATVNDGWFALWWPQAWDERRAPELPSGISLLDADGRPMLIGYRPAAALTVALADGSTREVALPAWDQGAGSIVITPTVTTSDAG